MARASVRPCRGGAQTIVDEKNKQTSCVVDADNHHRRDSIFDFEMECAKIGHHLNEGNLA